MTVFFFCVLSVMRQTSDHWMSLMSQTNDRGKSFISLWKTLSNISLWATVKWFFQSPMVPEDRAWRQRENVVSHDVVQ